jgi:cellulose synthase/poly-beta-1,6-N-acetylglucosamine synthase-like glycosyltransferase
MDFMAGAFAFLVARSASELFALLWFVLVFDVPRYFIGFASVLLVAASGAESPPAWRGRVSVLVAGHNEEHSFERCVRSLRAQDYVRAGFGPMEIVCVDDGSRDATAALLRRLQRQGLVDKVVSLRRRGGKSAALNLAASLAGGEVFVVVDCDCTFAPDAISRLVAPFVEPDVGAVAGAVLVRGLPPLKWSSLRYGF